MKKIKTTYPLPYINQKESLQFDKVTDKINELVLSGKRNPVTIKINQGETNEKN